ncbi:MAG TPA: MarR family transcriptional regulator [Xanthobacteraceae bacterium]|nr:MarR family transcriptional regulator [Xanthobacteraceae bacterium]
MLRRTETIDDTVLSANGWHAKPFQERPGFLIRRLHQIHVALFVEECGSEKITPVQYSILSALDQMGNVEQIALSRAVGLDTTNVADVLARLERQRMVRRRFSPRDKRRKVVTLTEAGRAALRRIDAGAARAHERTLAALEPKARARFVRDLARLVELNKVVGPALLALR